MSQDLHWEDVGCVWCGTAEAELVVAGTDLLMSLPGRFQMMRCTKCGLIRQNPRLVWESLSAYYPADYSAYDRIIANETSSLRRMDRRYGMRKRLRAIERLCPSGKLLDVGCGTGVFLAEAMSTGRWDVRGVEPVSAAAEYVRKTLGIRVDSAPFSRIELPLGSVDVITMWNVLEHLYDPIADLRHAWGLLREDGWLVMSIPNLESLDAKLFRDRWIGWDLPRHLYLFSQALLSEVLRTIGFRLSRPRCIAGSHAALGLSIAFWMSTKMGEESSVKKRALDIFNSYPVRLSLALPLWLADRLRLCSIITVAAQKAL